MDAGCVRKDRRAIVPEPGRKELGNPSRPALRKQTRVLCDVRARAPTATCNRASRAGGSCNCILSYFRSAEAGQLPMERVWCRIAGKRHSGCIDHDAASRCRFRSVAQPELTLERISMPPDSVLHTATASIQRLPCTLPQGLCLLPLICVQGTFICDPIDALACRQGDFDTLGISEAARWVIPQALRSQQRVRRSWSSRVDAEKRIVINRFRIPRNTASDSAHAGSRYASRSGLCEHVGMGSDRPNLADHWVDAHKHAFAPMTTPFADHHPMAYQGPQLRVWHRSPLPGIEADLAKTDLDPHAALPYWDWQDCDKESQPGACPRSVRPDCLGSAGSGDVHDKRAAGHLTYAGDGMNRNSLPSNDPTIFLHHADVDRIWTARHEVLITATMPVGASRLGPQSPPAVTAVRCSSETRVPLQTHSTTRRLAMSTTPGRPRSNSQRG